MNNPKEIDSDYEEEMPSLPAEDEIGSKIETFNLEEYSESGDKVWEIKASSAQIYDDTVKLVDVEGAVYTEESSVTIKAKEGQYDKQNNDIYLANEVVATTSDGTRMITDKLKWQASKNEVYTDSKVLVENDKIQIFGEGAWTKPDFKKLKFENEVVTSIKPNTTIACDGQLEVDYESNFAVFNDNVVIEDKKGTMWADKVTIYFSKEKEIERILARGNVRIKRGKDITLSQEAEYIIKEEKIIFTGKPRLLIYPDEDVKASLDQDKD